MFDYDMIVIGGGAAGISCGAAAAGLGAKTLVVDAAGRLGGECSWTGCVPSKALLHLAEDAWRLRLYGADQQAALLAANALTETRRLTAKIAADSDSHSFLVDRMGAEVVYGHAELAGPQRVTINGKLKAARKVILCTGSSPLLPEIPGLDPDRVLTNQNLYDLDTPPARLVILGAGPIGLEMGQAFLRLGSRVTVLTHGPRILSKDDADLSEELAEYLEAEGMVIERNASIQRVEHDASDVTVHFEQAGHPNSVTGDQLLVAIGRRANVAGLGLESVDIAPAPAGPALNPYLQTSQPWLYAAGDIKGHHQFSHSAEDEARIAVRNALLPLGQKADWRHTPWCTFTSPELAHLGPTEDELVTAGRRYRVHRWSFADDDRARTDGQAVGQVKLLATPSGRLLGAHVLGPRAGEVLNELVYAARKRGSVADLAFTIHVYPTLGLAVQRAADQWFEELMEKPLIGSLMRRITRRVGR